MEESWQEPRDNTEAKSDGRNWRAKRGRKKNVSGGRKRNPAAKAAGRPLTGRRVRPERRPLATLDRERLPLARRTWNRRSSSSPDQPVRRRQIRTGPASSCLPTSRLSRHLPVGGHAHTAHITREGDVALQVMQRSPPRRVGRDQGCSSEGRPGPRTHQRISVRTHRSPSPPPAAKAADTPNTSAMDPMRSEPMGVTPTRTNT